MQPILHIHVMINWQLSKQGIHWPVSPDCIAGSGIKYFLKLSAYNLLVFKWSQAQVHFFKCIRNKLSRTIKNNFDFKLTSDAKIRPAITGRARKAVAFAISCHGHSLVMIYVQFLCSDWSKLDRWVHAENLWSIWKLVYFDSWSWQSFVLSTCDVFNCLFPLDVQNVIQLLSRFFCYSWLVCLLGFWLRNVPLVKVIGNLISHGIFLVFYLAWCIRGLKSLKQRWLSGAASRFGLVIFFYYCIWCLFVSFSGFRLWSRALFMQLVYAHLQDLKQWSDLVSGLI